MTMDPLLLSFVVAGGIGLAVVAVWMVVRDLRRGKGSGVEGRLQNGVVVSWRQAEAAKEESLPLEAKDEDWFGRLVGETGLGWTADVAFLMSVACGLAIGGAVFLWREDLLAAVAGMVAGMLLLIGFLMYRRSRRRLAILNQLPEVMDLLARAVRAGESLDQALHVAGESAAEPVAGEFRRCARQVEMGLSLDAALRAMTGRTPLMETRILAATLTVQRETGGNLAAALERLAAIFRDRIAYQRQFLAGTATARAGAAVIATVGAGAAIYALVIQPEYVQEALELWTGRVMFSIAVGLQLIGVAWIVWLLRNDY